jgi:hypothetical protein
VRLAEDAAGRGEPGRPREFARCVKTRRPGCGGVRKGGEPMSVNADAVTGGPPRSAQFRLYGELARPVTLPVAALLRWPHHRADVAFACVTSGTQRHTFPGPLLRDVVTTQGPAFTAGRRKDRWRYLLAVAGRDGHRAVLSWAEIDPEFGNANVLLATVMDGHPLDAIGCQLVVPDDICGARYVSSITTVWFGTHAFTP